MKRLALLIALLILALFGCTDKVVPEPQVVVIGFSPGHYIVGVDIPIGKYQATVPETSECEVRWVQNNGIEVGQLARSGQTMIWTLYDQGTEAWLIGPCVWEKIE